MTRRAINVYVDAELQEQLRGSGLNFSEIAREAWRKALADRSAMVAEYGPIVPVPPGTHKRPYSKRWTK